MIDIYQLTPASEVEIGDLIAYQDDGMWDDELSTSDSFTVDDKEENDGMMFFYREDNTVLIVPLNSLVRVISH